VILVAVSLARILLSGVIASTQSDTKSIVAFSSIAHMSFILLLIRLGILVNLNWSIILMFAHGVISSYMFLFVGRLSYGIYSRSVYFTRGLFKVSAALTWIMFMIFLANVSVPPSIGFYCELMYLSAALIIYSLSYLLIFFYFILVTYFTLFLFINASLGSRGSRFSSRNLLLSSYMTACVIFLNFAFILLI